MDLQGALRARAVASAALNVIVAGRVYSVTRPQNTPLPAITFQRISDPRPQHLKGFNELRDTRVQFDCWGNTSVQVSQMAEALIAALVPEQTGNGIVFNRAIVDSVNDGGETVGTGFVYRVRIDLIFWWQEE